jgi:uncharacterized membrane protein YidH (DUF202 family)
MNFWVKNRFWLATALFLVSCGVAVFLLLSNYTIVEEELRYSIVLTIIGIGFTASQFYFQINENRYRENQEDERRQKELKIEVFKDILKSSSALVNTINVAHGMFDETDEKKLEIDFMISLNEFKLNIQFVGEIFFPGIKSLKESSDLNHVLNTILFEVSRLRKEIEVDLKDSDVLALALSRKIKFYNWTLKSTDLLKELVEKRNTLLIRLQLELKELKTS